MCAGFIIVLLTFGGGSPLNAIIACNSICACLDRRSFMCTHYTQAARRTRVHVMHAAMHSSHSAVWAVYRECYATELFIGQIVAEFQLTTNQQCFFKGRHLVFDRHRQKC